MAEHEDVREPAIDPRFDPAADHEPTRPTWRWWLGAVVVAVVALSIANWPTVSAFAHFNTVEHALGIG